ncbi:MAG: HD domain-containing protein [Lachnospiraceae bacterium]|nr:HD domain-containing protein [Lachnospiraceae bacterium]
MIEKLEKLIINGNADDILSHTSDFVAAFPIIERMVGFDQENWSHPYELWEHCVRTCAYLNDSITEPSAILRWAAIFHDIGKVETKTKSFSEKQNSIQAHYYGHPAKSREMLENTDLPFCKNDRDRELFLWFVEHHDDRISERPKHLRPFLDVPRNQFKQLMALEVADGKAHLRGAEIIEKRINVCEFWQDDGNIHEALLLLDETTPQSSFG